MPAQACPGSQSPRLQPWRGEGWGVRATSPPLQLQTLVQPLPLQVEADAGDRSAGCRGRPSSPPDPAVPRQPLASSLGSQAPATQQALICSVVGLSLVPFPLLPSALLLASCPTSLRTCHLPPALLKSFHTPHLPTHHTPLPQIGCPPHSADSPLAVGMEAPESTALHPQCWGPRAWPVNVCWTHGWIRDWSGGGRERQSDGMVPEKCTQLSGEPVGPRAVCGLQGEEMGKAAGHTGL